MKMINKPNCVACSSIGVLKLKGQKDFFCGSEGSYTYLKCPNCNLYWISPQPTFENLMDLYNEFYDVTLITPTFPEKESRLKNLVRKSILFCYKGYPIEQSSFVSGVGLKMIGMILGLFPPIYNRALYGLGKTFPPYKENGRLLEVGCGRGWYLKIMRSWGYETIGIEANIESAKKAKEIYGVEVLESFSLEEIPSESFDVITMIHVFEHLYEPEKTAKECYRILKPNGMLLLAMPNGESLTAKILGCNYRALAPPWHLYIHNTKSIKLFLEKFGFKTEATSRAKNAGYVFNASRAISKGSYEIDKVPFSYWFQALESFLNLFYSDIGEELEVVAVK